MEIKKIDNQSSFGSLKLKRSVLKSSERGFNTLQSEINKIGDIAKNYDITIRRPLFQYPECDIHTDFFIKIKEIQPKPKNVFEKIKNIITKPLLIEKEEKAGLNFGFFDDPLQVTKKMVEEISAQRNSKKRV